MGTQSPSLRKIRAFGKAGRTQVIRLNSAKANIKAGMGAKAESPEHPRKTGRNRKNPDEIHGPYRHPLMTDAAGNYPRVNGRIAEAAVDSMFLDRWSPRAFSAEPVQSELVCAIFEAARWAPSAFNHQPWLYMYADSDPDHERFLSCLDEKNQIWARQAPIIAFALSRKNAKGAKAMETPNRWAPFDTGASWMALALEARKLGLYTHAMAGFTSDHVYDRLGVPREKYDVWAGIAIGWLGDPEDLPDDFRALEIPSSRKPLGEVAVRGLFPDP